MPGRTINKAKAEKINKVEAQEVEAQEVEAQEEKAQEEQVQEEQAKEEVEEKTPKLIALYPILFESHQYKIGEQLPTHNMDMVEAWVKSNAAIWK